MKGRILSIAAVCGSLLFLSCGAISGELEFQQNGAGTLRLEGSLERAYAGAGDAAGEKLFPFVLPREELQARIEGSGLRILSYEIVSDGPEIVFDLRLGFSDPGQLSVLFPGAYRAEGPPVILDRRGTRTRLRIRTTPGIDAFSEWILVSDVLTKDRSFVLDVRAPRTIRRVSAGTTSGPETRVSFPIQNLIRSRRAQTWTLEY